MTAENTISRSALDALLLFTNKANSDQPQLEHLYVHADGTEIATADAFGLAIVKVNMPGLAGKLLDATALRAFLKGVGSARRDSQEVAIQPHESGDYAVASCGAFSAHIPFPTGKYGDVLSFPDYRHIVTNNPVNREPGKHDLFAMNPAMLERIGKALKPFTSVRVYPAPQRSAPTWFIATENSAAEDPSVSILQMPQYASWPECEARAAAA